MPTNQPSSFLDHKGLALMKGLGPTATDSLSAENPIVGISLLTDAISLNLDGWSPQIPSVKNGGVWSDSPVNNGRQLLAAPVGNLTEKMTLIVKGNSYLAVQQNLVALGQMASDCRNYWQDIYQIDPVYLMWFANCGVGPQYALLYNIELASEYIDSPTPSIRVSMTLEREPYWRGLPPGANPKLWTFYVNNQAIGLGSKVLADATLVTGTDHLITQTINNKHEWSPTAYGLQTTPITKNYIDIPASLVPGDAPALVEMGLTVNVGLPDSIYIGRSSKKYSGVGHDGITRANALSLAAGDENAGLSTCTKQLGAAVNGLLSNGSAINYYYAVRTSTGVDANFLNAVVWGGSVANGIKLDREMLRGTFAVFVRAVNSSVVAPVLTDMRIRVFIEEYEDNATQTIASITLQEAYPNIPFGAGGADQNPIYMGTVTLPLSNRAVQSPLGYGVQLQEANGNLRITVQQKVDVATANRTIQILDLILMPIDEGMTQVKLTYQTAGGIVTNGQSIIDNTGYLSRGQAGEYSVSYLTNANSGGVSQEVRGQEVTLLPRVAQRLYFMIIDVVTGTFLISPLETIVVKLNIIPRWTSIRDV